MPDPKTLKVGELVRIIAIPIGDEREYKQTNGNNADTYNVLKWMVGKTFTIDNVDDYHPWVIVRGYPDPNGGEHSMALMDTDSWVRV